MESGDVVNSRFLCFGRKMSTFGTANDPQRRYVEINRGPRSKSRLVIMVLAALVILIGLWLVISGVLSFVATKIGGMWVMTTERCFFVPDIGGWIGRIWQAGVATAGIVALGFGGSW